MISSIIDNKNLSNQEKTAVNLLKIWKGTNNLTDVAPTIYTKWIYFYLKNTYQDEMGEISFKQFLKTHIMKQSMAHQTKNQKIMDYFGHSKLKVFLVFFSLLLLEY